MDFYALGRKAVNMLRTRIALATALLSATVGCDRGPQAPRVEFVDVPSASGSIVPQLALMQTGDLVVSWLEPRADKGYRFRAARWNRHSWSEPVTIDDSTDIAMFTADLPGIAQLADGAWLAYWERKDTATPDPVATVITLARSTDLGRTWTQLPPPHRDGVAGEHSFLSAFAIGPDLGLAWLDARKQRYVHTAASGGTKAGDEYFGAIGLRYASFRADGTQHADAWVDPITCECCPTSAAVTTRGPVIVYRDRVTPPGVRPEDIRYETPTVRDIHLVRFEDGRWTEPRRVHADDWVFNACPDNGPAVDAVDNHVAVAWWTAAGNQPRACVAFSEDAGDHFGPPTRIDAQAGEGQVTVAIAAHGRAAVVGWLENHQTWARWVWADGRSGPAVSLGHAPNHSRLPRWITTDDGVLAVWTDEAGGARSIRMARLRLER